MILCKMKQQTNTQKKKNSSQKVSYMKKKGREYYIFAGEKGVKKMLSESGLKLSPIYFMIVKEKSGLGWLIKEEAKRRVKEIKTK